jgi:molybdopterin-guanine dinucleotide biosynthesis protein A
VDVEAALLTGGAGSRMGRDKSKLPVRGEALAMRIARLLAESGISVTVLGREPLPGHAFLADRQELAGPLAALSRFRPRSPLVFVCACDLPGFDPAVVSVLQGSIGASQGAVPVVDGRPQPLCALYRAEVFEAMRTEFASGGRSLMGLLDRIDWTPLDSEELSKQGMRPESVVGVNTIEEFECAVRETNAEKGSTDVPGR